MHHFDSIVSLISSILIPIILPASGQELLETKAVDLHLVAHS